LANFRLSPDKVIVIPNCISPLFTYVSKSFNQQYPTILQIGTKANKNLPHLIKAIRGIACKLIIIGKLPPQLITLLMELEIDYENMYDISLATMIDTYQRADMVTLISTYEGVGMPIIESQASGRPVITSNCSSMPEVAGGGALQVAPNNIGAIKEAIVRVISDQKIRDQLIKNGLENVKRFSPSKIALQYADLYSKVFSQSK